MTTIDTEGNPMLESCSPGNIGWIDERVQLLRKLWADGLSASQIAGRLGGITRNAVIGKVHRLGLEGRSVTVRRKKREPSVEFIRFAPKATRRQRLPVQMSLFPRDPVSPLCVALLDLEPSMCRWPIGDPRSDNFSFCGCATTDTYCEHHARIAYQPTSRNRKK